MTEITDHLADIVERVARACARAQRPRESVTIVAISKRQSTASIAIAHGAGLTHFGESYVQEALGKMEALHNLPLTWHFVGRLQANKTRAVAERFDWVHTVDRLKTAERLSEQRPQHAAPLNVLLQVNQGREPGKSGAAESDVPELARAVQALPRLRLRGLMTIPPQGPETAKWFEALAALQARLVLEGLDLDTLSMGMSSDFESAIEAGATFVRIGTRIFGSRA